MLFRIETTAAHKTASAVETRIQMSHNMTRCRQSGSSVEINVKKFRDLHGTHNAPACEIVAQSAWQRPAESLMI